MLRMALIAWLFVLGGRLPTFSVAEDETPLFDGNGRRVAYIAEDLTIYLWSGKPVAYLEVGEEGAFDIYAFNGKHLGWFAGGVVRHHSGFVVGAIIEKLSTYAELDKAKGRKQPKPDKAAKMPAPPLPRFVNQWSEFLPLLEPFLLQNPQNM